MKPPRSFLLMTLSALAITLGARADDLTLAERLAGLAARAQDTLRFEETRSSTLLDRPVTYRGWLAWDAETESLTKRVLEPREARLVITATELRAETRGRSRRLPLERRPELAALLGGVRALLTGDAGALADTFQADYLEGDGGAWVMHLVPRDPSLVEHLVLLEIRGTGDRVEAIDTVLTGGERQHMRILPPETGDTERDAQEAGEGVEGSESPGNGGGHAP